MKDALVIYHKNCDDGFTAAYCAWQVYKEKAEYVALGHDNRDRFIEEMQGSFSSFEKIFILDFSFSKEHMESILAAKSHVIWLDHHKTAIEEWVGDGVPFFDYKDSKVYILLDQSKSGAMLAWEYFNPNKAAPQFIKYIDDYDRWVFRYPDTKAFHLGLGLRNKDFRIWDFAGMFLISETNFIIKDGLVIQDYYDKQLIRSIEQTKQKTTLAGIEGLVCNLPTMFCSEAGHILAKESGTFGATWFINSEGKECWSLRSNGDFNVSALAKKFGGGGHKNAAGFVIK